MKTTSFLKKNCILFLFFLSLNSIGQTKFVATGDIFGSRVFIKNNGQFDKILPNKTIEYAYSKGDEQVYFNKNGVTYFLQKRPRITHSQFEKLEHGGEILPIKNAIVNVNWENSNPDVELIVSDKQSYYHSFGDEKYKSECFKKITYKNIYHNIDIEYLFTNERTDGIKYNVIVHPGGNVNDIKIKYSGDVKKIVLKKGNIIIKTPLFDITELAPTSYQNNQKIDSKFSLNNDIISFLFPSNYDPSKELQIDPWIINLTLTSNNYGFDVDFDYSDNFYVFGGSGPFLISKYSANGTLIWTFNGTVPSIGWSSASSGIYAGNFIVDKVTEKIYTGEGFGSNGARIIRLNINGVYDNFVSPENSAWQEVWDMGYNCGNGTIFGIGGGTSSNASAGILNTTTAAITPQNFTGLTAAYQDIASHTIDPNGVVFFIFAASSGNTAGNKLLRANSAFNGNTWFQPSTFQSFYEVQNKNYPGTGFSIYNSNGFNALASNSSYLYLYDGLHLAAYNKLTGAILGSITISGQTITYQGGIAVDNCNNVYIGGNGFIKCYNFNGTAFIANGTIPVATNTTNKYVTDIKLKPGSNELYVCGNGFAGIYTAINSLTCSSNSTLSINSTLVGTNNTTAIATLTTNSPSPIITYTWLNSNNVVISQTLNSTSLTDTVLNLTNGSYIVVAQIDAPCGPTTSQTFSTTSGSNVTPLFDAVLPICSGATLAPLPTTSLNGIIGVWSPALNNLQTTTYTFTPNGGQNANSTTLTITVIPSVTPTFNSVAAICAGDALSPLPTTSLNGVNGLWSPALNNTQTTTYTFTPSSGTCVTTATLTIVVIPRLTPTFTPIDPICWGETPIPILPTTSLNGITGTWQPDVISNTVSGTYIFTPTPGQCFNLPPDVIVTVYDNFDFEITKACIGKNLTLQVVPLLNSFDINSASFVWSDSSNLIVSTNNSSFDVTQYLINNSIIPQLPISFNVEVVLPNGCSVTHTISLDKLYCDIQKGISPNGDNLNDFFDLQLLDVKKLKLFNRYGTKVYSKSGYINEWKGQSDSGKELPDGAYYYVIDFNTNRETVTGWIYINREQ